MQSAPTPHIHEAIKVAGSKRGEVNRAYLFLLHELALPGGGPVVNIPGRGGVQEGSKTRGEGHL